MQPDPPPADFVVVRSGAGGVAIIAACRAHLPYTKALLKAGDPAAALEVGPANVDSDGARFATPQHGCKGHLEGWPVTAG